VLGLLDALKRARPSVEVRFMDTVCRPTSSARRRWRNWRHSARRSCCSWLRLARLTPAAQRLWSWQFAVVHPLTAAAVAWDHRRCLRALGVEPVEFRRRAAFARRLERDLATAELQACVS
jgi:hypothetical protein